MGNINVIFLFRDKEIGYFLVRRLLMDKILMDGGVGKIFRVMSFVKILLLRILFVVRYNLDKYFYYFDFGIMFLE